MCYAKGEGVPKDESKAVHWYEAAAAQGHDKAQYSLGMFISYQYCFVSCVVAKRRSRTSAGVRYDEGRGVTQDKSKAVQWYAAAAAQGHAEAQYNLGTSVLQSGLFLVTDQSAVRVQVCAMPKVKA
jgi:TPR repeat protein